MKYTILGKTKVSDFFKNDETGKYSMSRLITFMVTFTLCLDMMLSFIFVGSWTLTLYKFLWGSLAIGGKNADKLFDALTVRWKRLTSKVSKKI